MVPLLSLSLLGNILQLLHRKLLPKLYINQNLQYVMATFYPVIRGLSLGSIEIEQTIESINLFVLLYQSAILAVYLLQESLKLMPLESSLD